MQTYDALAIQAIESISLLSFTEHHQGFVIVQGKCISFLSPPPTRLVTLTFLILRELPIFIKLWKIIFKFQDYHALIAKSRCIKKHANNPLSDWRQYWSKECNKWDRKTKWFLTVGSLFMLTCSYTCYQKRKHLLLVVK